LSNIFMKDEFMHRKISMYQIWCKIRFADVMAEDGWFLGIGGYRDW